MLAPLRQVRTWRFGLYYVVVFGAYVAFSLWLPSYYKNVYHLTLAKSALLTAFFIFPASLLRPVGGWLSDRFGARPVTYAVFIVMLLASMMLAAPPGAFGGHLGLTPFFLLVELLGIGMGLGKASVYKYIPEYFPNDVGAAGGLVGSLGALGGFVLPDRLRLSRDRERSRRELLLADDRAGAGVPAVAAPGGDRHPATAQPRARDGCGRAVADPLALDQGTTANRSQSWFDAPVYVDVSSPVPLLLLPDGVSSASDDDLLISLKWPLWSSMPHCCDDEPE